MEHVHRIKIKIGTAEFEAEGKPELVQQQFDEFKAMVADPPKASVSAAPAALAPPAAENGVAPSGNSNLPQTTLDRVFRKGDTLSLMDTPKTDNAEADALLVLIYGHTEMQGQADVAGTALTKSASKTGLAVDRISRTIAGRSELVRSSGVKKGTRYSLNNRGIAEAERLIKAMVE